MKKLISIIAGLALLCLSACSFGAGNAAVQEGACSIGLPTRNADGESIGEFRFTVELFPEFDDVRFTEDYRAKNLKKAETNSTSEKTIQFRELPCGKYTATVTADGITNEKLRYKGTSEVFEIEAEKTAKVAVKLEKVPVEDEKKDEEGDNGDVIVTEPEEGGQKGDEVITEPEEEKKDDDKGDQTGDDVITDPKDDSVIFIGRTKTDSEIPDETNKFNNFSTESVSFIVQGDAYVANATISGEGDCTLTSVNGSLLKNGSVPSSPAFTNLARGEVTFAGNSENTLKLGGLSDVVYQAPFLKHQGDGELYVLNANFNNYNTCCHTAADCGVISVQGGSVSIHNVTFNNCKNMYKTGSQNEEAMGYQIAISQGGLLALGKLSSDNPDGIRIFMDNSNVTEDGGPFICLFDLFAQTDCPVTVVLSSEINSTPFICQTKESLKLLKGKVTLITSDGLEYTGDFNNLFSLMSIN